MELQNLVKIKIQTLDSASEPFEVTVATNDEEHVSAETVFTKVCDQIGLDKNHRNSFSLFSGTSHPTCRYRPTCNIALPAKDLSLQKWCFSPKLEQDMMKQNSQAAHLLFLQARHDISVGKFFISSEVSHKLDGFLEEQNFPQELQYISLCQSLPHYFSVYVENCKLDEKFSTTQCLFPLSSVCSVYVSKYGLKLIQGEGHACVTWYEVQRWQLDRPAGRFTLTVLTVEDEGPIPLILVTEQAPLLLAASLELIGHLQSSEENAPSFFTSMISLSEEQSTWENSLHDPRRADTVRKALNEGRP